MNLSSKPTTHSRHIIYPALMTILFFVVALSPVDLLGCRTRGLLAFAIALLSGVGGIFAAVKALKGRIKGDGDSPWWGLSAILLAGPVVAMLIMA